MKMFAEFIVLLVSLTLTKTSFVTNLNSEQLNGCPENCTRSFPVLPLYYFGKSSYYFDTNLKGSRDSGVIYCRDFNMELVSIESEEENTFLGNTLESLIAQHELTFWTSGMLSGDIWYWMSTGKQVTYQNWAPNEPRNGYCLKLENTSPTVWIADTCTNDYFIICEGSA